MITKNKNFNIIQETVKVYTEKDEEGNDELYIKGIANSGLEDREGDVVTSEALSSIVEQATNCNLHFEHGRRIKDIVGTITEAMLVDEGVEIVARIRNRCKDFIGELLSDGIKLGFSIAGLVEYEENNFSNIVSWDLTEVSLVAIPCDPHTMGTVTSKSFKQAIMEVQKMAEEQISIEDVTKLINEAITEVKEDYDARFEAIDTRIAELEKAVEALQETEPAPQEGEGEGDEGAGKELELKLESLKKELEDFTVKTVDDNILEFVSKAFNRKEDMRQPTFKFVDQTKDVDDEEEKGVPTSAEMADLIIKGQI